MSELIDVRDRKACQDCKYCKHGGGVVGSHVKFCDYITAHGKSRCFVLGKRRIPKGFCDKFEKKERNKKVVNECI